MAADFFLCKELQDGYCIGVTGEYATPQAYFAAEKYPEDFAEYEAKFPAKETLILPGHLAEDQASKE
ncbi:MAG: hypothetical protein K6G15_06640 [Desulfovibrio sp.]|nr:hypothetical protein [Desulfovibrio sp.]